MTLRLRPLTLPLIVVLLLAGCGGGGGGGGGSTPPSNGGSGFPANGACTPSTPAPVPTAALPAGQVYVTGVAQAQIVGDNLSTGALDYSATTCKPIRAAVVELLDANGNILLSTKTDPSGNFAGAVPANTSVRVRVKAQMVDTSGPSWNVTVRDNTNGNALYALDSALFNSTTANVVQNVTAGYGWDGSSYSSPRASGPFAILDTVYRAMQRVLTASPNAAFPALTVYWSVNNVSASPTNISAGQITTTYFTQDGSGNRAIYVLGKADNDTDEFDETVIAHEWGHYFQNVFSRDDSNGGQHSGGQLLDMRVAFSEGWGNAWSGMATSRSIYTDSNGPGQTKGFAINLAAGAASNPGWFKESSVESILYNFYQGVGFGPIFAAMTGPLRSGEAVSSIHAFGASVASTSLANAAAFNTLAAGQSITTSTDPLGGGEANGGGFGSGNSGAYTSLPLYKPYNVNTTVSYCLSSANDSGSTKDSNKLGEAQFLRFSVPTTRTYTVTVTGGYDPDFEVFQSPSGFVAGGFGSPAPGTTPGGGSETGTVNLTAGTAVLVIQEADMANAGSPTPCYNVSVM